MLLKPSAPPAHDGTTATIDLQALADNLRLLRKTAPTASMACVVKANAYGLGLKPVARALEATGCHTFYTALFTEALELRRVLPRAAIACFYGIPFGAEREAQKFSITPVMNDLAALERMRPFAHQQAKAVPIILQVDTGMNRLGFPESELEILKNDPSLLDGYDVTMVLSHFACSDDPNHPLTPLQRERFVKAAAQFPNAKKSLSNSHGIFLGADYHFDQCRPGRALYGADIPGSGLKQVVQLHAPLLQVRRVDSDGTVGYGATHPVKAGARLATLAAGYADGLLRSLSNPPAKTVFYFGGHPVPVVGRVSMDLIVLDVSEIPESLVHAGAEIEILGPHQSVDALAASAGTIGYEILTNISARVERRYLPLNVQS